MIDRSPCVKLLVTGAALIAVIAANLPATVFADVVASANFEDNEADIPIVFQHGGTGWSEPAWDGAANLEGTWTGSTNMLVTTDGVNKRAEVPVDSANGGTAHRGFANPLEDVAGNTFYIHFDAQNLSDNARFFGVAFGNGFNERMLIGQGTTFTNWTLNRLNIGGVDSTVDSGADSSAEAKLMLRIVFGGVGVPESVSYWVNPNFDEAESSTANTTALVGNFTTFFDFGTIDRLRIGGGNTSTGVPPIPFAPHWIDNLVIEDESPFAVDDDSADFDEDGDADGADFLIWQRGVSITTGAELSDGDADHDGAVDGDDLAVWTTQFGAAAPAATSVPEPATAMMAVLAIAGVTASRRTRTSMGAPSNAGG